MSVQLNVVFATILSGPCAAVVQSTNCNCEREGPQTVVAGEALDTFLAAQTAHDAVMGGSAGRGACTELCAALIEDSGLSIPSLTTHRCLPADDPGAVLCDFRAEDGGTPPARVVDLIDFDLDRAETLRSRLGDVQLCEQVVGPQTAEEWVATFNETETGDVELVCTAINDCSAGRRPRDGRLVAAASGPSGTRERNWWSQMARLEATAVDAFAELAHELETLAAPSDLVRRAKAAREDEIEHARLCRWMAGLPAEQPAAPVPGRRAKAPPLLAFAIANATEGCVREAFAALEVADQSRRTPCPRTRAVLRRIAADETRHAQLSWDIDAWLRTRVGPGERGLLDQAMHGAAHALAVAMAAQRAPALSRTGRASWRGRIALLGRFVAAVLPSV